MARLSLLPILAYAVAASAQAATPPASSAYQLNIFPASNIQTCQSTSFSYTITPTLNTFTDVLLSISIHSSDGSFNAALTSSAMLGQGTWLWNQVNVPGGQYHLTISSADPQFTILGSSAPFLITAVDTSCLSVNSGSATASNTITNTASNPTPTPPQTQSPPPNSSTRPTSPSPSHSSSSSSSSSSTSDTPLPSNPSSGHTSTGLKAGVAIAVVAVVLSGAGALYWLLVSRRSRTRRAPNHFGYDPGYGNLGSRDDQIDDKLVPADPLGRTFSGGPAGGGAVNSHSHSGLLDEKSTTAMASSNGATAGHSGVDSFSASGHPPAAPQWVYPTTGPPVTLVTRSTSGCSVTTGEGTSTTDHEPFPVQGYGGVPQTPKRATRKPVPAYGEAPVPRPSQERRKRTSDNSMTNISSASSSDLPAQPARVAPNLNHKGSFGDSKPMNHVLMPDMPLSQE